MRHALSVEALALSAIKGAMKPLLDEVLLNANLTDQEKVTHLTKIFQRTLSEDVASFTDIIKKGMQDNG